LPYGSPESSTLEKTPPAAGLEFDSLLRGAAEMQEAGRALEREIELLLSNGSGATRQMSRLNRILLQFEQNWLHEEGIPGRPWFKHLIYAARYTYAHLELRVLAAGVRDSVLRILIACGCRRKERQEDSPWDQRNYSQHLPYPLTSESFTARSRRGVPNEGTARACPSLSGRHPPTLPGGMVWAEWPAFFVWTSTD